MTTEVLMIDVGKMTTPGEGNGVGIVIVGVTDTVVDGVLDGVSVAVACSAAPRLQALRTNADSSISKTNKLCLFMT